MTQRVAIFGASVRAAAASAVRAGYRVTGCDLFGDEDLRLIADRVEVVRSDAYPDGFADVQRSVGGEVWCYTGGLENHPELIERMSDLGPLWGNAGGVLRRVRDPWRLAHVVREGGFRYPRMLSHLKGLAANGEWLVKSKRGTGGNHVRRWHGELLRNGYYLQELIEGIACSAVYVGSVGRSIFVGASRQLLWCDVAMRGDGAFRYVGSVGPLSLSQSERADLEQLGSILVGEFGLAGMFGVDFVRRADGIWPIEVNPRFPASAEVIELACGLSLFRLHADAFRKGGLPPNADSIPASDTVVGKLVVFAPGCGRIRPEAPCYGPRVPGGIGFADIPRIGTSHNEGEAVLTILVDGSSVEVVHEGLVVAAASFLRDWFEYSAPKDDCGRDVESCG